MSNTKTNRVGSIIAFTLSAAFIVAAVWIFLNRQQVLDQLTVWGFTPTSEVQTVNGRVGFTEKGTFLFYATRPEIHGQDSFNQKCPRQEAGSPILGCYTTEDRIFIYNITNDQLDGMEEVTAAHEMLHAAWYRMSDEERAKLTEELRAAYEKLDQPELKTRMEYYERTEPGEFANELHSILGTEVESLGDSLETYYAKYFDRATVLALHKRYNSVYVALHDRADTLFAQLQSLSDAIKSQSESYDAAAGQLGADIDSFNARATSGSFSSQAQFNAERSQLMRRSTALESQRNAINASISSYNGIYGEYQAISQQVEVLNESLDSYKEINQGPSV